MTIDDPAQPQLVLHYLLFFAVAQALRTGATAARRSRKISVPVGYKFSPTDGDLVNHHLKRKIMNLPEEHCLIPEYYHYEAEPWDLINKYNELSDGESRDDTCYFFSINPSSKRTNRKTPKGRWHETSDKMLIVGSNGVKYVMKYFTYCNGQRRQKKGDTTSWRMREYTDPSQKELALCKIFNDVDGQKKKKDGCSSAITESITNMPFSSESPTPEAYANIAMESQTPKSVNMRNDNLVSPQLGPSPLDESQVSTPSSDFNIKMTYEVISSSHQQPPMHTEEGYPFSPNAFADQFLNFNDSQLYDSSSDFSLMKDGVIDHQHQQLMHTEEESLLAQNAFADKILDSNNPRQQLTHNKEGSPLAQNASAYQSVNFIYPWNTPDDEFNKDLLYPHSFIPNTSDVPHSKRRHMDEGTSLEASQPPPMKKLRIPITQFENLESTPSNCGDSLQRRQMDVEIRNLPSTNNSPFNSSISFTQRNNMLTGYGSEEVNFEEDVSLFNPPTQPRNLGSSNSMVSSQHQLQVQQPHQMTGLIPDSYYNMCQGRKIEEVLASPSDWISLDDISLDDIFTTNGTDIEGHSDESTICLSSSNFSTFDKVNTSEPPGIERDI